MAFSGYNNILYSVFELVITHVVILLLNTMLYTFDNNYFKSYGNRDLVQHQ